MLTKVTRSQERNQEFVESSQVRIDRCEIAKSTAENFVSRFDREGKAESDSTIQSRCAPDAKINLREEIARTAQRRGIANAFSNDVWGIPPSPTV